MTNIGILELQYHQPYASTIMKVCRSENNSVTLFTTEMIFSHLKQYISNFSQYQIKLKNQNENVSHFLKRVEKFCNENIDLLFVNTIQGSFFEIMPYLDFNPSCKKILTVHNVNSWLKPMFYYQFGGIDAIKNFLDFNIRGIMRKLIIDKYDGLNVIYSPLRNYIQNNTSYTKPIFNIPSSIYEGDSPEIKHKNVVFMIPGGITQDRRDYESVLKVFKNIFSKYNNVELILLGRPIGVEAEKLINKFRKLKNEGNKIQYFDKFVDYSAWQNYFINCDVVILPIITDFYFSGNKEIYGMTKGSGVFFECIKFSKIFIISSEYNLPKEIKNLLLQYHDLGELEKIIEEILTDKQRLKKLNNDYLQFYKSFSLEKQREYLENEIFVTLNIKTDSRHIRQ
jgi:hypothetical protein